MDRQKMLLIFGGAWLSAALLTWLVYSITKAPKSDKTQSVVAAARDLPAGTRLHKGDVKMVKVGDKDIAKGAIVDEKVALEHPLLFPVNMNEPITVSKLASAAGPEGVAALIEPGKRAVSVAITDVSGAAGLIMPRSHVDVLFTKPGTMAEAVTTTVLQDAVVLSVGRATEVSATPPSSSSASASASATAAAAPASNQTRAVTLLVTPEQAEKVELAKNQGKVSLSLRNPLDKESMTDAGATTTANLFSPNALRQRGMMKGKSLWSSMTDEPAPHIKIERPIKEPPPKPRNVIDVYRGEKHVQEIFQ